MRQPSNEMAIPATEPKPADAARILRYRRMGYSPARIATLFDLTEAEVHSVLRAWHLEASGT